MLGNPSLQPEYANSLQVGREYHDPRRSGHLVPPVSGRLLLAYKNITDAVTGGVELDGEVAVTRTITVAAAYLHGCT